MSWWRIVILSSRFLTRWGNSFLKPVTFCLRSVISWWMSLRSWVIVCKWSGHLNQWLSSRSWNILRYYSIAFCCIITSSNIFPKYKDLPVTFTFHNHLCSPTNNTNCTSLELQQSLLNYDTKFWLRFTTVPPQPQDNFSNQHPRLLTSATIFTPSIWWFSFIPTFYFSS
jgi:hypothetical protein